MVMPTSVVYCVFLSVPFISPTVLGSNFPFASSQNANLFWYMSKIKGILQLRERTFFPCALLHLLIAIVFELSSLCFKVVMGGGDSVASACFMSFFYILTRFIVQHLLIANALELSSL